MWTPMNTKPKRIRTSLNEPSNLQDIVDKCVYLLPSQCEQLYSLLNQFHNLFDGRLKTFKGPPVHLELIENLVPVHWCPYTIPTSQLAVFKEELRRLISIGVIEKAQRSEWIAGIIIVPKKDGRVQWITDFRGLNKSLRCKVYHIRKISEIFQRRSGYQYFTKLDLSMQYYTFVLDEPSRNLCTFATPFGLYRYCRLPMGVSKSPTSQRKRCIQFWMISKALNFIWTISEFSVPHGPLTYPFSQPFWDTSNMWVLQLTH